MKLNRLLGLLTIMILLLSTASLAVDTPRNIVGTISGLCAANANVSVYGFSIGQLDNFAFLEDSANTTTNGAGAYATVLTDLDPGPDAGGAAGLEIRVNITNADCSPTTSGTVTDTATNIVNTINGNISLTFTLDSPTNASIIADNTTTFNWTTDIISGNYTLLVDDDSDFSSPTVNVSNILVTEYTLPSDISDALYYWRIEARQNETYLGYVGDNQFTLISGPPSFTGISPSNTTWNNDTSVTLYANTTIAANCAYATAAAVGFGAKTPFTTTGTTTHSTSITLSSEGSNTFYLQCNGTNGQLQTEYLHYVLRDTTGPAPGTITVNGGAVYATNYTLNISYSGFTDASSGVAGYYANSTNNSGTTIGALNTTSPVQFTVTSDGVQSIHGWAVDAVGNIGVSAQDSITVDTTGPTYANWSSSPAALSILSSGDYVVNVDLNDLSGLLGAPQLRYRIGSDAYTSPADMTNIGGNTYQFTISEQAPPNNWSGRAGEVLYYIVNATDIHGFTSNSTQSENIVASPLPPTFATLSNQLATQGTQLSITLTGSDPNGDSLTYSTNLSAITITAVNSTTSTATWTPSNGYVGTNIVRFSVTDGTFTVNQSITIVVTNINDAPVLSSIGDQTAYEYIRFNLTINATDPDYDNVSYSDNSSFFAVGTTSGLVSFIPLPAYRGVHTIQFVATDTNGASDNENVTFTVGYCGDATCSASYEDCESCQADCGVCEEDESQGFIISPKTCLSQTVSIRAVELITRGTCSTKGTIINGLETCANLTSTTVNIEQKILGEFVQIDSYVTDDNGTFTYTPTETGSYRLRYDSTEFDDNAVEFTIRECSGIQIDSQDLSGANASNTSTDDTTNRPAFPELEEPTDALDITQLSQARKLLLFLLLPLLFVLLSITGVSVYYNYKKPQGGDALTNQVDAMQSKIRELLAKTSNKIHQSKGYKAVSPYLLEAGKEVNTIEDKIFEYLSPILIYKKVGVPYYALKVKPGNEHHLVLLSLLAHTFKRESLNSLVEGVVRENKPRPQDLRAFAVQAMQLGLPLEYHFSVTHRKEQLLTLHQLTKVSKSYPTEVDMKKHLLKGAPLVVMLNMHTLNAKAPDRNFYAVVKGYNQKGFMISDYEFTKAEMTTIPYNLFKKAWERSGFVEVIVIKKKFSKPLQENKGVKD